MSSPLVVAVFLLIAAALVTGNHAPQHHHHHQHKRILHPGYQSSELVQKVRTQMGEVSTLLSSIGGDEAKKRYLEADAVLAHLLTRIHSQLSSAEEFLSIVQSTPVEQLSSLLHPTPLPQSPASAPPPPPTVPGHPEESRLVTNARTFVKNISISQHERDAVVLWRDNMRELFGVRHPEVMRVERMITVGEDLTQKLNAIRNRSGIPVQLAADSSSAWVDLNNLLVELEKIRDAGQSTFRDFRDADLIKKMTVFVVGNPAETGRCSVCGGEFKSGELAGRPGAPRCTHPAHIRCAMKHHEQTERWNRRLMNWASTCAASTCGQSVVPSSWAFVWSENGINGEGAQRHHHHIGHNHH